RLAGGKTGRDQQRCVHEVQPEPNLSRPSPEDFSEKPAPPAPWGVEMRDDLRKLGGRSPCPLAAPYLPPGGERGRQGAGQGAGRGQVSCPLMAPPETRRRPPLGEGLRDLDRAELLDDLLDVVVSAALLVGPANAARSWFTPLLRLALILTVPPAPDAQRVTDQPVTCWRQLSFWELVREELPKGRGRESCMSVCMSVCMSTNCR